ncbi:MAG: rhomboid family intramembrane serine protease [Chitinophagaceae bacterium]|nr:rhomboid family intramembrane serine protease [Chitinophagaceae bacterium]
MSDLRLSRFEVIPPVVKNLIIINVLFFIAQYVFSGYNLTGRLALYPIMFEQFKPYQIFTHMFSHGGIPHIIFNMFSLWMFGSVIENYWKSKRFLVFYIVCGLGSAALHMVIQYIRYEQVLHAISQNDISSAKAIMKELGPMLGASGAVMGILAAFGYLFPNRELFIIPIPFPIKAKWVVLSLIAIDLFGGIANIEGDNIAHFAHLGGAITGLAWVIIWNKTNRRTFY